jgi:hypothetical protein
VNQYQVFDELSPIDYAVLKHDIPRRGILVPIELDSNGEVLDGHHRLKIAEELGITDYPTVVRNGFGSEQEKLLHVIALNLHRRHLTKPKRQHWIHEEEQLTIEIGDEPPAIPRDDKVTPIRKPPSSSAKHATERQRTHRLRDRLRPQTPCAPDADPWEIANDILLSLAKVRAGITNTDLLLELEAAEEGVRQLAWGPSFE